LKLAKHRFYIPAAAVSRPTRARGLKLNGISYDRKVVWSRPTRARGLKHKKFDALFGVHEVAPHAGAWIETATDG